MSPTLLKGNQRKRIFLRARGSAGVGDCCCSLSVEQLARLINSEQQFSALYLAALLVGSKAIEQPSSTGFW